MSKPLCYHGFAELKQHKGFKMIDSKNFTEIITSIIAYFDRLTVRNCMALFINLVAYIATLSHLNIDYSVWLFDLAIIVSFITTTALTSHFLNFILFCLKFIKKFFVNKKEKYKQAILALTDKELNLLRSLIEQNTNQVTLENCYDSQEMANDFKTLDILKEKIFLNRTIYIEFKKDFINLFKRTLEKINVTSLSK